MDTNNNPRRGYSSLSVARDRGLIWVCDISKSSSYINNNDLAEHFEAFLPRLHWASSLAIHSARGEFIQWTGDGFIAWFPLVVERELGPTANRVLEAIWHFTTFINATQLCVESSKPFRIRHGLTYEPDALITLMTHKDGHESKIVSGRNVVLAFRLSGVEADFPNVATQSRIEEAVSARTRNLLNLRRWELSEHQVLRHFKGERMGTTGLYVSGSAKVNQPRPETWVATAQRLISKVESGRRPAPADSAFIDNFYSELAQSKGQDWCKDSVDTYVRFIQRRGDVLASLQRVLDVISRLQTERPWEHA